MYSRGEGVPTDREKAAFWWEQVRLKLLVYQAKCMRP
jgi:TPR repeat protein